MLPNADRFLMSGRPKSCGKKRVKCTIRAAGVGVQACRERFAEITSGRSYTQQGLTATCKDFVIEGKTEA